MTQSSDEVLARMKHKLVSLAGELDTVTIDHFFAAVELNQMQKAAASRNGHLTLHEFLYEVVSEKDQQIFDDYEWLSEVEGEKGDELKASSFSTPDKVSKIRSKAAAQARPPFGISHTPTV